MSLRIQDNYYYGLLKQVGGIVKGGAQAFGAFAELIKQFEQMDDTAFDKADPAQFSAMLDSVIDQGTLALGRQLADNLELRGLIGAYLMIFEQMSWFKSGGDYNFVMGRGRQRILDTLNNKEKLLELAYAIKAHKFELGNYFDLLEDSLEDLGDLSETMNVIKGLPRIIAIIDGVFTIVESDTTPERDLQIFVEMDARHKAESAKRKAQWEADMAEIRKPLFETV